MKKNIIAMAVAAAVAAPAAAMADTTLYGKIHASYDFFGGDTLDDRDYSFASNSSRLGIKGKEEISDNLSLIYQWEETVDWGDDNSGLGGARNTFIGFTGDWGTAIAGRHDTPMKQVGRKYDLFGDTVGDSRAIIRGRGLINAATNSIETEFGVDLSDSDAELANNLNDWDLRTNNTVAYMTPNMGGFTAKLAYVSDWSNDLNNDNDAYSVSAGYEIGGFMIDAAYEVHNADTSAAQAELDDQAVDVDLTDDQTAIRVGAGYKVGGFKVVGLYQQISDAAFISGLDVDMWGVGGAYSFGKSTIKAQYYVADDYDGIDDSDADLWAVGYDYKLSKQTSVYAAYASMTQGNMSNGYAVGSGTGHGHSAPIETTDANGDYAGGQDSNAFSVGIVHKF